MRAYLPAALAALALTLAGCQLILGLEDPVPDGDDDSMAIDAMPIDSPIDAPIDAPFDGMLIDAMPIDAIPIDAPVEIIDAEPAADA